MAELGGREMVDTAVHRNLGAEAKRVGDAIAEEVGDTFIDWRSLAPRYQWQRIVQMVIDAPLGERRALLDALDAVPPVCELCDHQHAPMVCVPCHNRTADRAERAERERDALRADNDRLRKTLRQHAVHRGASRPSPSPCDLYTGKGKCSCGLAEALSADADADAENSSASGRVSPGDAEPDPVRSIERDGEAALTRDFYRCPNTGEWVYRWCDERMALRSDHTADAEPEPRDAELRDRAEQVAAGGADFCTAWNDEFGLCDRPPDHPGAHERVTGLGATVMWRDPEPSRAEGACWACHYGAEDPERWQDRHTCGGQVPVDRTGLSRVFHPSDAEGGRPREADPQGTPSGNGDASVDGGGDDGRSRAIQAACDVLASEQSGVLVGSVERAIDAALASGGVVPVEDYESVCDVYRRDIRERRKELDRAESRVRELEAAVRGFVEEEDDHEPGKWIQSPDSPSQMIKLCAGEYCGMYWPCSVERLRRAALGGDRA